MILYFDNRVINEPLIADFYSDLEQVRKGCRAYNTNDKLEITLYTLASYAELTWSEVIIKYQLHDPAQRPIFEKFVSEIFPRAHLIYGRSDNQKKFQETVELINGFQDEWIFYAGNNDHPFIAPTTEGLQKCLDRADRLKKEHPYISVIYSHFTECLNMPRKGTPVHDIAFPDAYILEEDADAITAILPRGYYASIQMVNRQLLNHWVYSQDLGENIIYRIAEGVEGKVKVPNQVLVIPKQRVCDHFDGYSHTRKLGYPIPSDIVPPLFIPQGFFEKKIKIAFGYDEYREGWVNINPLKNSYSFRDPSRGTDLMMGIEDIPLFWKSRIAEIDSNPRASLVALSQASAQKREAIKAPFEKRHRIQHWVTRTGLRARKKIRKKLGRPSAFIPIPLYRSLQKSMKLKKLYGSLIKKLSLE